MMVACEYWHGCDDGRRCDTTYTEFKNKKEVMAGEVGCFAHGSLEAVGEGQDSDDRSEFLELQTLLGGELT